MKNIKKLRKQYSGIYVEQLPLLPLMEKYCGLFFFRRRQPSKRRKKKEEERSKKQERQKAKKEKS